MKNFLIKKGYKIDIVIDKNDDFKSKSQLFINTLEENYKEFIKKQSKFKNKIKDLNKSAKDKSNFLEKNIDFEILSKMSPLTIINAPWGTGKTHFIEEFAILFYKEEINSDIFKNIIKIDVWKFSSANDIPDEIIAEIFLKLSTNFPKLKNALFAFAKKTYNTVMRSWMNKLIFTNFNEVNVDNESNYEKLLKNLDKIKPTIIFLDNIERIGKSSWDVMKAIQKMSILKNLIFVLPMNMSKMKNNEKIEEGEYPIEKYIDIKYYEFKQNYFGLLTSLGFNENISNSLNNLFSDEIDGEKLSIRELEQRINDSNVLKFQNNIWRLYKIIYNQVWGSYEIAEKNLISYLKEINVFNKLLKLYNIYNRHVEIIKESAEYYEEFQKLYSDYHNGYRFTINLDYLAYNWLKISNSLNENILFIEKEIKHLEKENISLNQGKKKLEDSNLNLEKQKDGYSLIVAEEEKKTAPLVSRLNSNKENIMVADQKISSNKKSLEEKENLINQNLNNIEELKEKKQFFNQQHFKLKELNKEWKKYYKEYIELDKLLVSTIKLLDNDNNNPIIDKINSLVSSDSDYFDDDLPKNIIKNIFRD